MRQPIASFCRQCAGPARLALLLLSVLWLGFAPTAPALAEASPFRRGVNIADYLSVVWFPPNTQRGHGAFWYTPDTATIDSDLQRVRRLGFDFVRIVVDAAALTPLDGAERAAGLATVARVLERVPQSGLGLVVGLAFPAGTGGPEVRLAGPQVLAEGGDGAQRFLALLNDIAYLAARLPPAVVAIEPLAEPPVCTRDAPRWFALQEQALARLRGAGFRGWTVVSPACFATLGALLTFDPRPLMEERTLVTFHFYEPYAFTHQGHSGLAAHMTYLEGLPFPFERVQAEAATRAARERLMADRTLSEEERQRRWVTLSSEVDTYRATGADARFVRARFEAVAAYMRALGIPPDRVLVGEFGASVSRLPGRRGAEAADRMRYAAAVREAAETVGFGWAFWQLWGGFGLAATREERCIEMPVLEALAARPDC